MENCFKNWGWREEFWWDYIPIGANASWHLLMGHFPIYRLLQFPTVKTKFDLVSYNLRSNLWPKFAVPNTSVLISSILVQFLYLLCNAHGQVFICASSSSIHPLFFRSCLGKYFIKKKKGVFTTDPTSNQKGGKLHRDEKEKWPTGTEIRKLVIMNELKKGSKSTTSTSIQHLRAFFNHIPNYAWAIKHPWYLLG